MADRRFIVILLILSAFLSGSETALTATSRARMLRMQQEGSRRAGWVAYLLDQHERLLGAILLGNNLVNILASVLATSVFLRLFGETGVVYATLMMTVLVVVFAEVLPKTYAIQTPDQTALRAAGLLRILVGVLAPFTKLLQLISRTILRAAGFTGASAGSLLPAHEELRGAIDLHHKEGGVRKRDRDMLGGILDLGDTHVDEVMVHRKSMLMIDADLTPAEIVKQALDSPIRAFRYGRASRKTLLACCTPKICCARLPPAMAAAKRWIFASLPPRHGLCPKPPC